MLKGETSVVNMKGGDRMALLSNRSFFSLQKQKKSI
jgi:hypothetical protein